MNPTSVTSSSSSPGRVSRPICVQGVTFQVADTDLHRDYWTFVETGRWEPHTFKIFKSFVTAETTLLDIGSWIGPTVLYGASLAKRTYALEPDPSAYLHLEKNILLNPDIAKRVILSRDCISAENGDVVMGNQSETEMGDSMSSLLFAGGKQSWRVKGWTLETFLAQNGITDTPFIKMDIEGGEALVVPLLQNYLKQVRPDFHLSLHPPFMPNREADVRKVLDALGTYPFWYNKLGQLVSPGSFFEGHNLSRFQELVVTTKSPSELQDTPFGYGIPKAPTGGIQTKREQLEDRIKQIWEYGEAANDQRWEVLKPLLQDVVPMITTAHEMVLDSLLERTDKVIASLVTS